MDKSGGDDDDDDDIIIIHKKRGTEEQLDLFKKPETPPPDPGNHLEK